MTESTSLPSPLSAASNATQLEISGRAGRLRYYVAGDGPPMLLIHSINAAGSVAEVRPVFEHYCRERRVYAPDLPGFGGSDRSSRNYDARLYTDALHDMLDVIGKDHASAPVDALALSLSSEFLARAAAEAPQRFRSLALVTPTGFRRGSEKYTLPEGSNREMRWLSAMLEFPLWRSALYNALVSPRSIRYFLRRTWGSDGIDEQLAAYCDLTTHQPGAANAPYAFLSGRLFSTDIRSIYEKLDIAAWLPHGTRGDFTDFSAADWTDQRGNWQRKAYETGALPFFELPGQFFRDYSEFLDRVVHNRAGVASPVSP